MLAHLVLEAELHRGTAGREGDGGVPGLAVRLWDWFASGPRSSLAPDDRPRARSALDSERRLSRA